MTTEETNGVDGEFADAVAEVRKEIGEMFVFNLDRPMPKPIGYLQRASAASTEGRSGTR